MEAPVLLARRIETISPLDIQEMAENGTLPRLPASVDAVRHIRSRQPTLADLARYEWVAARSYEDVVAVAGFRDHYDPHFLRDVVEIVHVAGSTRGCVDLTRHIIQIARARNRGVVGTVDLGNDAMMAFATRLGARVRTVRLEL